MYTTKKITILGDIHQKYQALDKLNLKDSYVVQLGDLGFDYQHIYNNYDPNKFKVCLGNHEDYDNRPIGYDLGDYGYTSLNNMWFFFVRGAFSIDKKQRFKYEKSTGIKCWWPQEELNHSQGLCCLEHYEAAKPDVVMSHDCPYIISKMIGNPEILRAFGFSVNMTTSSQELMQQMLEIHQPKLWLFGHYHQNVTFTYHGTRFICVGERAHIDFNEKWEIINE